MPDSTKNTDATRQAADEKSAAPRTCDLCGEVPERGQRFKETRTGRATPTSSRASVTAEGYRCWPKCPPGEAGVG